MKKRIELLIKHGFTEEQARFFVENLAQEAYEAGRDSGKMDQPGIIGEVIDFSGPDFFEWLDSKG